MWRWKNNMGMDTTANCTNAKNTPETNTSRLAIRPAIQTPAPTTPQGCVVDAGKLSYTSFTGETNTFNTS